MSNKKVLFLFTKGFPFGASEPFLELEYELYNKYWDKVVIVTTNNSKDVRVLPEWIDVIWDSNENKRNYLIWNKMLSLFRVEVWHEIFFLLKKRIMKYNSIQEVVTTAAKGRIRSKCALKWLKKHPDYEVKTIYSYWANTPAYSAIRFKEKLKGSIYCVTRAHRFDLYEYAAIDQYIPFRKYIYKNISEIAAISDDGKDYLVGKYPDLAHGKVFVSRLGAKDVGNEQFAQQGNSFRIVSCSRMTPVKRIHRIVEALSEIKDIEIEWTHIGGGQLENRIKELATQMLPSNVRSSFTGVLKNEDVYKYYNTHYFDVFLNVSESEGVPVTIMEAMSYGILVVATNVGGTKEIVMERPNGYLLDKEFCVDDLIRIIREIATRKSNNLSDYNQSRIETKKHFMEMCDAETNYKMFLGRISRNYPGSTGAPR